MLLLTKTRDTTFEKIKRAKADSNLRFEKSSMLLKSSILTSKG